MATYDKNSHLIESLEGVHVNRSQAKVALPFRNYCHLNDNVGGTSCFSYKSVIAFE